MFYQVDIITTSQNSLLLIFWNSKKRRKKQETKPILKIYQLQTSHVIIQIRLPVHSSLFLIFFLIILSFFFLLFAALTTKKARDEKQATAQVLNLLGKNMAALAPEKLDEMVRGIITTVLSDKVVNYKLLLGIFYKYMYMYYVNVVCVCVCVCVFNHLTGDVRQVGTSPVVFTSPINFLSHFEHVWYIQCIF